MRIVPAGAVAHGVAPRPDPVDAALANASISRTRLERAISYVDSGANVRIDTDTPVHRTTSAGLSVSTASSKFGAPAARSRASDSPERPGIHSSSDIVLFERRVRRASRTRRGGVQDSNDLQGKNGKIAVLGPMRCPRLDVAIVKSTRAYEFICKGE